MSKNTNLPNNRFKLIAAFLTIGIISLAQPGCSCSSSNGGTPSTPSPVTAVSPEAGSVNQPITTNVTAQFLNDMDGTSVINGFKLTLNNSPVVATVTYDVATKITTLTPLTDLVSESQYRATLSSSIMDTNGDTPLSTDYVWSFDTSPTMQLVSKNTSGVTSNDRSENADIDATGRYIVFESEATNLSSSITTTFNRQHIYRKDTITGKVLLASSDASGLVEANNQASNPAISSNGRYVVFDSTATNLDAAINSNGISQIYLKDMEDGSIDLISRDATRSPDNSIAGATKAKVSDDGLHIVFQSPDNNLSAVDGGGVPQIYLKNMSDESVLMISRTTANAAGNNTSSNPDMSNDGNHIVFESRASNLTAANGDNHIYYVDTSASAHRVEQISVNSVGVEADASSNNPSVSDDGLTVVFDSLATNLDAFDINGVRDVFFRYRPLVFTKLVSANPGTDNSGNDASGNAKISGDAKYVAFESLASDLVTGGALGISDIFVRDLSALPETTIVRLNKPQAGGEATSDSLNAVISTDGRYVSFHTTEKMSLDDTDTLFDIFKAHNSTHP